MSLTYHFDHDLETVLEKLTDTEFLRARSQAMGEKSCHCQLQREGEQVTIRTERIVGLDLPKVALKFFTAQQHMQMTETWRKDGNAWQGEYHVDIDGQPLQIDASFTLTPTPGGCCFSITHRPSVDIPLVKKPAERFIANTIEKGTRAECDYLRDQLR